MDIRHTQEQLLILAKQFDVLCEANQIRYTLHGGSLLGAIREHGFIPWDDDLDIAMTREEFRELEHLLEGDETFYLYGRIKRQFRTRDDNEHWIDIFICDYIGEGLARKVKLGMLTILDIMARDQDSIRLSNTQQYSKSKQIAFRAIYYVGRLFSRDRIIRWYLNTAEHRFAGDRQNYFRSNDQFKGRAKVFPTAWMDSYIEVPFEDTSLPVMQNYHEMLVQCYGENYMTPVKDNRNAEVHDIVRNLGDTTL